MQCPKTECAVANDDAHLFCEKCGTSLTAAVIVPSSTTDTMRPKFGPQAKIVVIGKKPSNAVLYAIFIPGGGQLYNNDYKKFFVMAALAIFGLFSFGIGTFGVYVWSIADAHQVASQKWSPW